MDLHAMLIRTLIGPLWARWERSPYLRDYRRLRRTQYDSFDQVSDRQWHQVKTMVQHAYETVPFYKDGFDRARVKPADLRVKEDYLRLPILTKDDIRANGSALRSRDYENAVLSCNKTSGSTGVSLTVWADEESMQWRRACTVRCDEWSGWRFGERVAKVWGNPEYLKRGWRGRLRNAVLERATYLDTLNMHESAISKFACSLTEAPPSLLFGHAHSVFLFAEFVRSKKLGPIRPKGIITSAMPLHNWQRKVIEDVFACKVTNRYGCEEVGLIACECERHEGLHINADAVYVEVLRAGRPVHPGESGSVVITDLTNRAMPIIRYQVGDMATVADRRCSCGRGSPLLERIEGREADYVVTESGALISGISLTENFAVPVPGIAQLQIVQETPTRFLFRIVREAGFDAASLEEIDRLVRLRFGPATSYECEYVDRIPQEQSGKYRFCISKVPNPFGSRQEQSAP